MRTLSPAELAALSRSPLPMAVLVEMDFSSPLYLCTAGMDLVVGGSTYLGTHGMGKIEPIQTSPAEIKPLRFELSGVPPSAIALADTEPVQGVAVRIKLLILDPDTYQPFTPRLCWAGRLDVFTIEDGNPTATLKCTAEHAAIDLVRPIISLYSDAEQRRLYAGDPSLQYLTDQSEMRVVWPAAAWGRR